MIFFVVLCFLACLAGYANLLYLNFVVPDAPVSCTSTAIYREPSQKLLSIDHTWNTVPVSCHVVVGTNNHADPKYAKSCRQKTIIILMTPIHLLEASGVPAFALQQRGPIAVRKRRFFLKEHVQFT